MKVRLGRVKWFLEDEPPPSPAPEWLYIMNARSAWKTRNPFVILQDADNERILLVAEYSRPLCAHKRSGKASYSFESPPPPWRDHCYRLALPGYTEDGDSDLK